MVLRFLHDLHERHERLKRYVHEGFRYPLPRWGQYMMGGVYFSIPLLVGLFLLDRITKQTEENIAQNSEKFLKYEPHYNNTTTKGGHALTTKTNGNDDPSQSGSIGNTIIVDGKEQVVGAGGWGGGVRLVSVTDEETQKQNQLKLRKFLRKLKQQNQQQQQEEEQERLEKPQSTQ